MDAYQMTITFRAPRFLRPLLHRLGQRLWDRDGGNYSSRWDVPREFTWAGWYREIERHKAGGDGVDLRPTSPR